MPRRREVQKRKILPDPNAVYDVRRLVGLADQIERQEAQASPFGDFLHIWSLLVSI